MGEIFRCSGPMDRAGKYARVSKIQLSKRHFVNKRMLWKLSKIKEIGRGLMWRGGVNLYDPSPKDRWRATTKIREIGGLIFCRFCEKWAESSVFSRKEHPKAQRKSAIFAT